MFLPQIRKQQKDHTELVEDYRTKQPQRMLQMPPQSPLGQPMVPPKPQSGGPTPVLPTNVPPEWTQGSGPPGPRGQRMLPHVPPHMPPTVPNNPQGPPHVQMPSSMRPVLTGPAARFTVSTQGPLGAGNVSSGDGATPKPQVLARLKTLHRRTKTV